MNATMDGALSLLESKRTGEGWHNLRGRLCRLLRLHNIFQNWQYQHTSWLPGSGRLK